MLLHGVVEQSNVQNIGLTGQRKKFAEYTATTDSFHERITHRVRKLSSDDRPMWRQFVDRHPTEPNVQARPGSQAAIRDFEFMCMGLSVDYYVTQKEGEITGFLTVNPFTNRCDEIAVLFVDPPHRRKGLAHSLLSVATKDILKRGRQPGYMSAGGIHDRPDLFHMLIKLGYHLVSTPWNGEVK